MARTFSASPQFTLGDDGTLDTVIDCAFCDRRERFNFADSYHESGFDEYSHDDDADGEAYQDFVQGCIEFCVHEHECNLY